MGVPTGGGQNLGTATGRIHIDTSGVRAAQNEVQNASQQMSRALVAIGASFSAQQFTRFVTQSDAMATSFRRQSVAAESLAGSQGRLNDLLRAYEEVTGGTVGRAQALADVTRLLSVGFADSTSELERFVTAARGISIATGQTQDYVVSQLQLAIANQSTMRLDQLGLGVSEVQQRIEQLRATNRGLTEEMAYQQAILGLANEKFGDLAESSVAAATGMEQLRTSWANFALVVGESVGGPVDFLGKAMSGWLDQAADDVQTLTDVLFEMGQVLGVINRQLASRPTQRFVADSAGRDAGRHRSGGAGRADVTPAPRFSQEATTAITDWWRAVQDVERQAARDRIQATQQYEEQRTSTIRDYEQTIAREARDFAVQRQRAEQDHANAIAEIREAAAQRERQMAEDLARTIARAQADSARRAADIQENYDRTVEQRRQDSAERVAEWEEDRAEREEEVREESARRIADIEADYQRDRERATREFELSREEAAARGDGRALYFLERRHELEQEEAERARDEAVAEERERLQEAVDQINEAHRERLQDEREALDKSLEQARQARDRQLEDEREALERRIADAQDAYNRQREAEIANNEQRIEDMEADFALRKEREDADRATRLGDMANEHTDRMTELNRQHGLRLAQISTHAQEERQAIDEEFQTRLGELELQTDAWIAEQERLADEAIKEFDRVWDHITGRMAETSHPSEADPYPDRDLPPNEAAEAADRRARAAEIREEMQRYPIGSPEHNRLVRELEEIEAWLRERGLPVNTMSASMAMAAGAMGGRGFAMPTGAGMGGGVGARGGLGGINIAMTINGAPGQSVEQLAGIIDERIYQTIVRATGAYAA